MITICSLTWSVRSWMRTSPSTLQGDILDAVGLTIEGADLVAQPTKEKKRRVTPPSATWCLLRTNTSPRNLGHDGQLFREAVGIEAARVRWWAANGPDQIKNSMALCWLHHKLFDRGAIGRRHL